MSAIHFFLRNSTFKVLTNHSLTCITILVKCNHDIESPFISYRASRFQKPIKQILMKVVLMNNAKQYQMFDIQGRGKKNKIQILTELEIIKECEIQEEIYRRSFCYEHSIFDPICPAIIGVDKLTPSSILNYATDINLFHLPSTSNNKSILETQLNPILNGATLENNNNIVILFMEFIEHFDIAENILTNIENYAPSHLRTELIHFNYYIMQFALQTLAKLGFAHGDSNTGNIMINPTEIYYSNPSSRSVGNILNSILTSQEDIKRYLNKYKGRVMLIDFERTRPYVSKLNLIIHPTQEVFDTMFNRDEIHYPREPYGERLFADVKHMNQSSPINIKLTNQKFIIIKRARLKIVAKYVEKLRTLFGDDKFEECIQLFKNKTNSIIDSPPVRGGENGENEDILFRINPEFDTDLVQHKKNNTRRSSSYSGSRTSSYSDSRSSSYSGSRSKKKSNHLKSVKYKTDSKNEKIKNLNPTTMFQELNYSSKYKILTKGLNEKQKEELHNFKKTLNQTEKIVDAANIEESEKELEELEKELEELKELEKLEDSKHTKEIKEIQKVIETKKFLLKIFKKSSI